MDKGIQKARIKIHLPPGARKVYHLRAFCWVECPPQLLDQPLIAYRCKTRKAFPTSVERSGEWPYWWIYEEEEGGGNIFRLEETQVEVLEHLGDVTEVEVIQAHHKK